MVEVGGWPAAVTGGGGHRGRVSAEAALVLLPWSTAQVPQQEPQQQDGRCRGGTGVRCGVFWATGGCRLPLASFFSQPQNGQGGASPQGTVPGPPTPARYHLQDQAGSHSQHGLVLPFTELVQWLVFVFKAQPYGKTANH